jgi:hypothetical protein
MIVPKGLLIVLAAIAAACIVIGRISVDWRFCAASGLASGRSGLDLASGGRSDLISSKLLERDVLKQSVLFGLAEQMGRELSVVRGEALRRSVSLPPGKPYMSTLLYPEFAEPHRRGELLINLQIR